MTDDGIYGFPLGETINVPDPEPVEAPEPDPEPVTITHDLVARIVAPGWSYGIARLQARSNGTVAVFVPPGKEPAHTLHDIDTGALNERGGVLTTSDGDTITITRRASGCGWPLAKCRVSADQLAARW